MCMYVCVLVMIIYDAFIRKFFFQEGAGELGLHQLRWDIERCSWPKKLRNRCRNLAIKNLQLCDNFKCVLP